MPNIPAICTKCGAIFPTGLVVGSGSSATFQSCSAGPCPKCNGTGRIPDGRYDIFGDEIFALLFNLGDIAIIDKSLSFIKQQIRENKSPEEIIENAKTNAPELQTLWDFIPKTRVEAYAFITLLILFLKAFIDYSPSLKSPSANTTVIQQQIINQSFQQFYSQNAPEKAAIQLDSHSKKKKKQQRKMKKETQRKSKKR